MALRAVHEGMAVVVGLQSTGEANTASAREEAGADELVDFVSAPKIILQRCALHACSFSAAPLAEQAALPCIEVPGRGGLLEVRMHACVFT